MVSSLKQRFERSELCSIGTPGSNGYRRMYWIEKKGRKRSRKKKNDGIRSFILNVQSFFGFLFSFLLQTIVAWISFMIHLIVVWDIYDYLFGFDNSFKVGIIIFAFWQNKREELMICVNTGLWSLFYGILSFIFYCLKFGMNTVFNASVVLLKCMLYLIARWSVHSLLFDYENCCGFSILLVIFSIGMDCSNFWKFICAMLYERLKQRHIGFMVTTLDNKCCLGVYDYTYHNTLNDLRLFIGHLLDGQPFELYHPLCDILKLNDIETLNKRLVDLNIRNQYLSVYEQKIEICIDTIKKDYACVCDNIDVRKDEVILDTDELDKEIKTNICIIITFIMEIFRAFFGDSDINEKNDYISGTFKRNCDQCSMNICINNDKNHAKKLILEQNDVEGKLNKNIKIFQCTLKCKTGHYTISVDFEFDMNTTLKDLYLFISNRMDPVEFKFENHVVLNNKEKCDISLHEFGIENENILIVPKYARLCGGGGPFNKKKRGRKRHLNALQKKKIH